MGPSSPELLSGALWICFGGGGGGAALKASYALSPDLPPLEGDLSAAPLPVSL